MPTRTTSVLVGSRPSIPATALNVVANAVGEVLPFLGGDYYLDHPTGALSLLTQMVAVLNGHTQLLGTGAVITRSRRVLLTNATAFSVDWGSNTTLRDLLGFSSNLASATSHLAPLVSPLLWAAGKPESSSARMGADGVLVKDTYAGRSGPGVVVATANNEWRENTFTWGYVHVDRIEQVPDVGGTWATWWSQVGSRFARFWLARNVLEDSADDATAMSLSTKLPAAGAYIMKHDGPLRRAHDRTIPNLELYGTVALEVETALEYGA